ncbi:arginyltransferase [Reinekea marina]|uniref:Aspartate/glutamate leucyltransferase n=1 Tax=Reinekea marina TaxID=1310421 RepID=A0ABV7WME9_9GAMM|nr:arginyltransferase [Reinekea marina]MDN3649437.1 arginyltransferase [Reinekea marina]
MSNSTQSTGDTIALYRTGEHKCSYLPDQLSRTIFVDPAHNFSEQLYEELTHSGFRRSGQHLYRPDCGTCSACIATRIPVAQFNMSKQQRRIFNKNRDLNVKIAPSEFRQEDYDLFEKYINIRHKDGDMYPTNPESYTDFLTCRPDISFQIRLFEGEKLISVAVTDKIPSGLSALYTFFDPDYDKRSLGTFSILAQIEVTKMNNLPYLYLGYWVEGCQKMEYKTKYQPIELLKDKKWQSIDSISL